MLSPYRVLDLTDDRGHFAGFLLAQMGADVVAVEPPEGQRARHKGPWAGGERNIERSLNHWAYNRGKKSVVVETTDQIAQLAEGADVLIECGAFDLDLEALRLANPALITVSLTSFGADGPKADWLGTDLTLHAASGEMSLNGYQDRAPVRISAPQVWVNAGAEAACAVTIALTDRRQSGLGQHVDLSAQEAMMLTAQGWLAPALCDNPSARRSGGGLELLGVIKFRFVYECLDGHVTLTFLPGVLVGSFTNRIVKWAHQQGTLSDELAAIDWTDLMNERQAEEVAEIAAATADGLAAALATKTKGELFEMAQRDKLLMVPVTNAADVLASEHYAARDFWDSVPMPGIDAPIRFPGPWAHIDGPELRRLGPPPKLGEHTVEILGTSRQVDVVPTNSAAPSRPLEGVTVIDFTWVYAGPFATRMLGYYGADVIRIESQTRPDQVRSSGLSRVMGDDGPEVSQQWHSINADKKSLQINLKVPESRQVVLDLVAKADIVINAFSPGVLERLGLGHEDLLAVNPKLIAVSTTLFGHSGPLSPIPGFGNMGAAMGGYYELTGWPDRLPAGPFLAYTDATSPRLTAAVMMAALDWRDRSGKGVSIDFSQAEGGVHFLSEAMLDQEVNGNSQTRNGNADHWMAPHGAYRCGLAEADQWMAIACETDRQWQALAQLLARPELASVSTADRLDRQAELDAIIEAWTAGQEPLELQERLQAAGVPAHQVQNSPEVVADPQLLHRDHFHEVPHEIYDFTWAEQYGFRLSRSDGTPRRAGPTWGEHNFEILSDLLGYDGEQIAELAIAEVLE
ncbi:MAG: crotonobetainyl-CoA:carnitine CoA-transferase CaiB-like acyl-CoA transferase [Acidimicrobiales bacterium]|jgi:crotonobetainyl-CoA:carnitine CoA-transferase CaiB-like acyl-CoA transferase